MHVSASEKYMWKFSRYTPSQITNTWSQIVNTRKYTVQNGKYPVPSPKYTVPNTYYAKYGSPKIKDASSLHTSPERDTHKDAVVNQIVLGGNGISSHGIK